MKQSAGTLLYRTGSAGIEVLIVQPSGPAARYGWSIPKGLPEEGESLEDAARRETREETGVEVAGPLEGLGFIEYKKSRKRVYAFAAEAPRDAAPRKASWEVAAVRFVPLAEARELLHADQRTFADRLQEMLARPRDR